MIYAQFYKYDLAGKLSEACGDRSVVILDGRVRSSTLGRIAGVECAKRGYVAWGIFKGDSFTRSHRLSGPNYMPPKQVSNDVYLYGYL